MTGLHQGHTDPGAKGPTGPDSITPGSSRESDHLPAGDAITPHSPDFPHPVSRVLKFA
jgi:hypothetical protein